MKNAKAELSTLLVHHTHLAHHRPDRRRHIAHHLLVHVLCAQSPLQVQQHAHQRRVRLVFHLLRVRHHRSRQNKFVRLTSKYDKVLKTMVPKMRTYMYLDGRGTPMNIFSTSL